MLHCQVSYSTYNANVPVQMYYRRNWYKVQRFYKSHKSNGTVVLHCTLNFSGLSSVTIFNLGNVCPGKQPPRYCTVIGGR